MNPAPANSPRLVEAPPPDETRPAAAPRRAGWSRHRWQNLILLVFGAQVALVFLFGEKKAAAPRAVTNVPTLQLAPAGDALIELNDPTLFALPHQRDFASAVWLKLPEVKPPSFRYTESPRWLPLSAAGLGGTFDRLMQTNVFATYPLDFKPALVLSTPVLPFAPRLPEASTLRVEGELASRQLPASITLTNWPYADLLAPCAVQVIVDGAGNVVSTVLLPPGSGYDDADQRALAIARTLRFTPAAGLTIGRIIFNWHTVPPEPNLNEPE